MKLETKNSLAPVFHEKSTRGSTAVFAYLTHEYPARFTPDPRCADLTTAPPAQVKFSVNLSTAPVTGELNTCTTINGVPLAMLAPRHHSHQG